MDTESLLRSLNDHNVDYVIIGATAFPLHGYSRATLDIDILIRPTRANATKAWQALKDFGYDMTDISIEEMLTKKILIRQYIIETDIHPFVKGATFKQIWKNKIAGSIGADPAYFASLDDLIQMKQAAGRDKDKQDLKYLRRLKKSKNKDDDR